MRPAPSAFFSARFRRQRFAEIRAQFFKKVPRHARKTFSPRFDAHDARMMHPVSYPTLICAEGAFTI